MRSKIIALLFTILALQAPPLLAKEDGNAKEHKILKFPFVELVDREGPVLGAWEGFAMWHNLPPYHPIALRVSRDERLVWGPEFLIEPIFDFSELTDLGIDHAQLELMLLDSPSLPDLSDLTLPLDHLLETENGSVTSVLLATVRLESSEPGEVTTERGLEMLSAEEVATMAPATEAIRDQRLQKARELLHEEYGDEIPLAWQKASSGLDVLGDFTLVETKIPSCLQSSDPDALWSCFWEVLGPAVVPEILPDDFPIVAQIRDRLAELEPEGWRAPVASAQIHLLNAHHRSSIEETKKARERCEGNEPCLATVALLENLAVVDRHASFSRGLSQKSLADIEPEYLLETKARNARLVRSWDSTDPATEKAASLWRLAADVRQFRGALEMLHHHLPPGQFEEYAQKYRDNLLLFGNEGAAGALLQWSLYPEEMLEDLPEPLQPVAAQLFAESLMTPNGSFGVTDLEPPTEAINFHREGLFSPARVAVDRATFERGTKLLVQHRGHPNPIMSTRRMLVAAAASISLGELSRGRSTLEQIEILTRETKAPQERAALKLLRARLAVAMQSGDSLAFLKEGLEAMAASNSPGRIESLLLTWKELVQQVFHHQNRYTDGLSLNEGMIQAAEASGFTQLAMTIILERLVMLADLSLFPQIYHESRQAFEKAGDLESILEKRNTRLLQRVEAGDLPELAAGLTSMTEAHNALSQIAGARLEAMAYLGFTWSRISAEIDRQKEKFVAVMRESLPNVQGVNFANAVQQRQWELVSAMVQDDHSTAKTIADTMGDPTNSNTLAVAQGKHELLEENEESILGFQKMIAEIERSASTSEGSGLNLVGALGLIRQALLAERHLYFQLSSLVGRPGITRQQFQAWLQDPLSGGIARAHPWREMLVRAQVLEAESNRNVAIETYNALAEYLLEQFYTGQYRNLHRQYIKAQQAAYFGEARLLWDLSHGKNALSALELFDLSLWLDNERTLYGARSLSPEPFPDLSDLVENLGPDAHIVVLGSLARYRELFGWVFSAEKGLLAKRFVAPPGDLHFKEAIQLNTFEEPECAVLTEITDWLGSQIPSGAPVTLVANAELRQLGVHLIHLGGVRLPLRNPMAMAPSLRSLATALRNETRGQGIAVVGQPLSESDGQPGEYQPLMDHARLVGLAGGNEDLFWAEEATVEKVEDLLAKVARVHFSTHGKANPIDPRTTGLLLHEKRFFNINRASRIRLPGSLVVLSACESGAGNVPSVNTASTLDSVFLTRGARAVVSTTIRVNPEAAALWMKTFHSALDSRHSPMAAAQIAYSETRGSFPKAADWGAFTVIGAGVGTF